MRRPASSSPFVVATLVSVAALASGTAAPAPADAATAYTIRGGGFGHGVGLSQYGAYGMARKGLDHRRILAHYYRGTQLGVTGVARTRVLLAEGIPDAVVSGAARVPGARKLDRDRTYRARPSPKGGVELRSSSGKLIGRSSGPLVLDGKGDPVRLHGRALNGITDGRYRGALFLHAVPGGLTAVNVVGLEDYLRGVVPGEMPSSWPSAALRAQAIAARSYALATARTGALFDQYPDTRSQVYEGVSGEEPETDAAVSATKGEIVRHNGSVATTFFHSTSGGRTESSGNAFGRRPFPYLRSVDDPHDRISPHHRWGFSLTREEMEDRLGSLVNGRYDGVRVLERGDSPRVLRAEVLGTRGRTPVSGATLHTRLGLRDTWMSFGRIDTSAGGAALATRSPAAGSAPAGVLTGKVAPAPAGGRIVVEREGRRGWRKALRGHADRAGTFRVAVERPGRYRIRAAASVGPAVRVGRPAGRRR